MPPSQGPVQPPEGEGLSHGPQRGGSRSIPDPHSCPPGSPSPRLGARLQLQLLEKKAGLCSNVIHSVHESRAQESKNSGPYASVLPSPGRHRNRWAGASPSITDPI